MKMDSLQLLVGKKQNSFYSLNKIFSYSFLSFPLRSKRKHDETLKSSDEVAGSKRHQKKRKTTELKNFYSFQIKEEKMKQLDIMRKRFEENKNRIQKMKEQRKFNPFA